MSPTSYQAAPPRVSARNLPPAYAKSRQGVTRVRQRIEQVENLPRPHHSPLLAGDALLRRRVALDGLPVLPQRVDLAFQRIDRRQQPPLLHALRHEVARAVLAALDRE